MCRLFEEAGITTGMKVLDVGSGAGDVAFLAARMVGPTGTVVGVDRDPGVLETARQRAEAGGLEHVSFIEGDYRTVDLPDDSTPPSGGWCSSIHIEVGDEEARAGRVTVPPSPVPCCFDRGGSKQSSGSRLLGHLHGASRPCHELIDD